MNLVWYRIELFYDAANKGSTSVSARINGTDFAEGTVDLDAAPIKIRFGLVTANTGSLVWDDIAINRSSWPGAALSRC